MQQSTPHCKNHRQDVNFDPPIRKYFVVTNKLKSYKLFVWHQSVVIITRRHANFLASKLLDRGRYLQILQKKVLKKRDEIPKEINKKFSNVTGYIIYDRLYDLSSKFYSN